MSGIVLPDVAALELTYSCSHQCIFCSCPWEANPMLRERELSTDEWKQAIDALLRRGVRAITLTGGEPLTRPDIREIISHVTSRGAALTLISNGRAMDEDFLRFLAENDASLCISVPGIETFASHTGVDNIEGVLKLFSITRSLGINTTANIAVTKKNLPELYENIALPLINGADHVLLNRFLPGGRGLKNTEYLLTVEEVNQMLDIAETVLEKAGRNGHVGTELPLCAIKEPQKYKRLYVSSLCAAAKDFFVIDPSGYVKTCNHSPARLCRYTELDSLAENEYWNAFKSRDYLPEVCRECDKREVCDGGCREAAHVFYGEITDNDPLIG